MRSNVCFKGNLGVAGLFKKNLATVIFATFYKILQTHAGIMVASFLKILGNLVHNLRSVEPLDGDCE